MCCTFADRAWLLVVVNPNTDSPFIRLLISVRSDLCDPTVLHPIDDNFSRNQRQP